MFEYLARLLVAFTIISTVVAAPGPVPQSIGGNPANASSPALPLASASLGGCGKCGIEAPGGVQLVYFQPDSTSAAASSTYTSVSDGFTFTSPSVYVIYSSLRATVTCGQSSLGTIGPSFDKKTIGYSSRFLAYGTVSSPDQSCEENVVVDGFHTIDFTSLYYHPITTSVTSKAGCPPYVNPRLSLPAELTNVDPSWHSCEPLFYGAFDPPHVLQKADALVPPSIDASPTTSEALNPSIVPSPPPSPVPTVKMGPSVSSKAPQSTTTEPVSSTVQTPGKAGIKPQDPASPKTSSSAAVLPSSLVNVEEHHAEGQSLFAESESQQSQQQDDKSSEPTPRVSSTPPAPNHRPTFGDDIPQKQSNSNSDNGETRTLNGQADALADHPMTNVASQVNQEETHSPDPENKASSQQSHSDPSSAGSTPNDRDSNSNESGQQRHPAADSQLTASKAPGMLPSIIPFHDDHDEPSNRDPAISTPSVTSPTPLSTDRTGNDFAQVQVHGSVAKDVSGGGLAIGSHTVAVGQHADIEGVTVSVGPSVIALDGATYTRASLGGSDAIPQTAAVIPEDGRPLMIAAPTPGTLSPADLSTALSRGSASMLAEGYSIVVGGIQDDPTYAGTSAANGASDSKGNVSVGTAILSAFSPTGSLPAQVASASARKIGTTSRVNTTAASTALARGTGQLSPAASALGSSDATSGVGQGLKWLFITLCISLFGLRR